MNKSDLVQELAEKANLTKKAAADAIDTLFADNGVIAGALKKGDKVTITGFGTFQVRQRAGRTGRNPRTGAEIKIGPSRNVAFSAGRSLKDAV